ncbi:MAG: 4Fe-4S binding protein [Bryobacterales bacterium]|nr:4Fe-4S binding protein [Bryobacterales bacterium]
MIRTAASSKEVKSTQVPFRKFPGIAAVADGAGAAVWVESHVAQAAASYPVQPARAIAEAFEDLVGQGMRNLWQQPLEILRAESPQDAASICEGYALTGARAVSFASGQALPAMTEALRTIAGKRLPMVFHVGARALQSQALATRTGHDDIFSVADCGWGIVFASDAQEVADLALICRRAAEYAETPFFLVQDAYATTHQIQDILLPEADLMRLFVGEPEEKLTNYFNPRRPAMLSPVQEEADYSAARMAQRGFFGRAAAALQASIDEFARLTGRLHAGVDGYRLEDAEHVLLGCGSMMVDARRTVDALRASGVSVGALTIRAFRPFPAEALRELLAAARTVTVLERTDAPLAPANPLTLAVSAALGVSPLGTASARDGLRLFSSVVGLGATRVTGAEFVNAIETAIAATSSPSSLVRPGALPPSFAAPPEPAAASASPAPAATGLALVRAGGSGAANANRLIASVSRALFGLRIDAEGDAGTEKVGKPITLRLAAASAAPRPCALETKAKLVVAESAGLLIAQNPAPLVADGGVLFCPFAASFEEIWRVLPAKAKREIQDRGIRVAGLDRQRVPQSQTSTYSVGTWADLVALGAWLRISSFLKESKLGEQEVYHRMFECLGRLYPKATDAAVDASYAVVKNAYLAMLRFAVPAEKVEIKEAVGLPVIGAPSQTGTNGKTGAGGAAVDLDDSFCEQIIGTGACPNRSSSEAASATARASALPADQLIRSLRHDAPEIPVIDMERCVGCMECVALCPDVAIVGRVVEPEEVSRVLAGIADAGERALMAASFGKTRRYWEAFNERNEAGGMLGLFVDADRCKGCGECVDACGVHEAIAMKPKAELDLNVFDRAMAVYRELPDTPDRFLSERSLGDMLLSTRAQLAVGGSSSCSGCGQSTAVRLVLASTGFQYGADSVGVVAASGCDSVYGAVFPYNPYKVPWTNTLSGNAPADALGIRRSWNREGNRDRKLWVLGSMENFGGAGLSALTALLASGEDINVLVLDSQVFECESRRIHGAAFHSQGSPAAGARQELELQPTTDLAQLAMAFPNVMVAQTTASHLNHFHRSIRTANEFPGPAVVICYATCMAEDGVSEDKAMAQAKLAVESRTFPLLMFDPRKGNYLRDRLSLSGNPAPQHDWYAPGKDAAPLNFVEFASTEERFAPYFAADRSAGPALSAANENRLNNWRRLQELAGLR